MYCIALFAMVTADSNVYFNAFTGTLLFLNQSLRQLHFDNERSGEITTVTMEVPITMEIRSICHVISITWESKRVWFNLGDSSIY